MVVVNNVEDTLEASIFHDSPKPATVRRTRKRMRVTKGTAETAMKKKKKTQTHISQMRVPGRRMPTRASWGTF